MKRGDRGKGRVMRWRMENKKGRERRKEEKREPVERNRGWKGERGNREGLKSEKGRES